jgi:hypothetical protein
MPVRNTKSSRSVGVSFSKPKQPETRSSSSRSFPKRLRLEGKVETPHRLYVSDFDAALRKLEAKIESGQSDSGA